MKYFTSQHRFAADIQTDDWFKLAGFLYRVKNVSFNGHEVNIQCYPVHGPQLNASIWLPPKQLLKIYNQK
jgi:hypothetical protein